MYPAAQPRTENDFKPPYATSFFQLNFEVGQEVEKETAPPSAPRRRGLLPQNERYFVRWPIRNSERVNIALNTGVVKVEKREARQVSSTSSR